MLQLLPAAAAAAADDDDDDDDDDDRLARLNHLVTVQKICLGCSGP
jgi:hypothetical protein